MTEPILKLARRCADKGLDYRAAKMLFDALYTAELLMITGNNRSRAAERAGVARRALYRIEGNETNAIPVFSTVRNQADDS